MFLLVYLVLSTDINGRLAQLVRAPALQAGGHRFDPCNVHSELWIHIIYKKVTEYLVTFLF